MPQLNWKFSHFKIVILKSAQDQNKHKNKFAVTERVHYTFSNIFDISFIDKIERDLSVK